MSSQIERRAAQRFQLSLPIAVRSPEGAFRDNTVVCHDVSSRGIYFYTEAVPAEGAKIEFTLTLPPEVTLTDPMRVDCRGRVVRVVRDTPGTNAGVAATIEGYNSFIRLTNRGRK
ncbi:MAG: PilZ domain-containing protein [Acidobacteria bacterium]|nr:PilZ domain-containing protein [Acidobacteriota bacterium]